MPKDPCVFHEATIGGLSFYLTLSADGPYIGLSGTGSGVAVGSCTSVENIGTPGDPSYCVCKYSNQQRIFLSGFDEATAKRFCQEFGVPFGWASPVDSAECFDESPAFLSLVAWAKKHPRLFARYSKYQDYMPWVSMVDNELHPEPDAAEYLAQTARVGDIFTVEAYEVIETEWKFQIIAILEQKGDRFYVGAKIGVELDDCQVILFDKDGEEIDSDGRGSGLGFYLCEKTKIRSAKSFKMVGFPEVKVAGKQGA